MRSANTSEVKGYHPSRERILAQSDINTPFAKRQALFSNERVSD
jgi:hypothetical protein